MLEGVYGKCFLFEENCSPAILADNKLSTGPMRQVPAHSTNPPTAWVLGVLAFLGVFHHVSGGCDFWLFTMKIFIWKNNYHPRLSALSGGVCTDPTLAEIRRRVYRNISEPGVSTELTLLRQAFLVGSRVHLRGPALENQWLRPRSVLIQSQGPRTVHENCQQVSVRCYGWPWLSTSCTVLVWEIYTSNFYLLIPFLFSFIFHFYRVPNLCQVLRQALELLCKPGGYSPVLRELSVQSGERRH